MIKMDNYQYFSVKSYVVNAEAILIHIQNMIVWKTFDKLGKNTGLL